MVRHLSFTARQRRRGNATMEFGLVFTIFLLMVVGLTELGRGVWTFNTIAHATRQGARYAQARGRFYTEAQTQIADEVKDKVRNAAVGLNREQVDVTTTWPSGITRGGFVVVQASYPFGLVTGSLILQQSSIQMKASTRVPITN